MADLKVLGACQTCGISYNGITNIKLEKMIMELIL